MKILIVDDNFAMRQMIRSVVASADDFVFECENGREAVNAFQSIRPDVVLMDMQMPAMNGIQATQTLKKNFPDANIIIVSNFNDQEFRDEAREAGASFYFVKDNLIELKLFIHQ